MGKRQPEACDPTQHGTRCVVYVVCHCDVSPHALVLKNKVWACSIRKSTQRTYYSRGKLHA